MGELLVLSEVGEINSVVVFIGRFQSFVEELAVIRWVVGIQEFVSRFIGFR